MTETSSTPKTPIKISNKDTKFNDKKDSLKLKKTFIKPESDPDLNPIDYWNLYGNWKDSISDKIKSICVDSNGYLIISLLSGIESSFKVKPNESQFVAPENSIMLTPGKIYTRFMLLTILRFKGNFRLAQSHVEFSYQNREIPYIRVGIDYFKIITKEDRYNVNRTILKRWVKDEIKLDHGEGLFKHIHRFEDFCIDPDNLAHNSTKNNCYNLYAPFNHVPDKNEVTISEIPYTMQFLKHIFDDQLKLGLIYFKALYEKPRQPLPILCLVSKERQTGKTTFLNWLEMIFGDNYVLINPEELKEKFNFNYATKNIIGVDETVIDKDHVIEKLKSLATAKTISVRPMYAQAYNIPFYGKIIICSNKERDFMRIDDEEIRFWVRKVNIIEKITTDLETKLYNEIPLFLKYLIQLPELDTTKSRMIFTSDQIRNGELTKVMKESKSWLYDELKERITEHFLSKEHLNEFKAAVIDIKDRYFSRNNDATTKYIKKLLIDEFKIPVQVKNERYSPFAELDSKTGTPYVFKREQFVKIEIA